MKTWWVGILVAALSAGAVAQEAKKGGEQKVGFEQRSFPFEGEVTGEHLNVRMSPKADPSSVVAAVLGLGSKVVVVSEKDDFYQILPPKGALVWVFGKNVKKEGGVGTVTANDVPVRMDSRVNAETLCTLKEGEQVKIVSEHMGWFKIEAPEAVKYFVGKKFVRAGAAVANVGGTKKADPRKPAVDPDAKIRTNIHEVDLRVEEQKRLIDARRLDEVDFSGVVEAYENSIATAQTPAVKAEAERGLKKAKDLQIAWLTFKEEKRKIDLQVATELQKTNQPKPAVVKQFAMEGYVDTVGLIVNRPGTHKLVMGGKIVCFLRAKDGDDRMPGRLNDQYQKMVGVNGTVIKNPEGWDGYTVVVVDEVVPITRE